MPLTDIAVRNAKPGIKPNGETTGKPYAMRDEKGLYLEVRPNGGKWWRYAYRFQGREQLISLGVYPDVSLKRARERLAEARQLLADGVNPSAHRKATKAATAERAANSFEVVAREWYQKFSGDWSTSHSKGVRQRLERDVYPFIGSKPIAEVSAPDLLAVVRRVEERGALETAHRELAYCGQIFRYAIATHRATRDVSADLRGALPPAKEGHFSAVTEPKKVGELLRALDGYEGTLTVRCALRLAPMVFVRPGELRNAEWADFDLGAAEWRYRVSKTETDHIVPLSRQAVALLRELEPVSGHGRYVFPGQRTAQRPMSDNAILAAMRRMGIAKEEMSGHGFRAMARTILDEVLNFPPHLIEHQLAHAVRDPLGRAYNRTKHLPERHAMMQQWADYLDSLKAEAANREAGTNVIALRATA